MGYPLKGKKVLITGASAGIGRAAAHRFLAEGADVWALARNRERLEELSRKAGGPPRLVPVVADVSDGPGMKETTTRILSELGVPDVIVANAGLGLNARFENTSDEDLARVFEVNVFGLIRTIRPFVLPMVERGSGRILLVSSVIGKRGVPHYTAYSGSKFAVQGIFETLRTELLHSGVKVGLVCPASTVTEFRDRSLREGPQQNQARFIRHSADSVAKAIVKTVRSGRREKVLTIEGKLLHYFNKFIPGILDRLVYRVMLK